MGIRFHCPNGHKLNVKAFLAGKKGVCPDCGVKFRIPERSEPGLESGIDEAPIQAKLSEPAPAKAQATTATVARSSATIPPPPMPLPSPMPAPIAPLSPVAPVHPAAPLASNVPRAIPVMPLAQPAMHPMGAPAMPVPPPPPPMPPGMSDSITENPLATWFVRPPSGGQFGPARGEVMRKWITEGRVTSDSLVWREGWTDWLPATEVFPSLGKPAAPLFSSSPAPVKSSASLPAPKKGSGNMGVVILVFLALICIVLVVVLALVLSGSLSST
jgi:hypothetical protein